MRGLNSNRVLLLSLVFLSIHIDHLFVIANPASRSSDRLARSGGDATPSDDDDAISAGLVIEDESSDGELEVDDNEVAGSNEFDWKHHHIDHGIYSDRSLLSFANVKKPRQNESHDDEDSTLESSGDRKSELKAFEEEEAETDPLRTRDYAEREWQLMFRSFDLAHDSMMSSMLQEIGKQTNLFDEITSRLTPQCRRDIFYVRDSVKRHRLWALRMLDSMGKIPSGVTYGRFSSPGDYEECISVRVDEDLYRNVAKKQVEKYKFHGKYCLIDFRLPLPERPPGKMLSVHESVLNFTGTELYNQYPDFVRNYSAYASVFYEVGYLHAFCLPSTCDVHDVTKAMTKALEGLYLIVNNTVDCEERFDEPVPLRKSQWIAIVVLTVIFVNAFVASVAFGLLPKDVRRPRVADQRRASMKPPPQAPNDHGGLNDKLNRLNLLEEAKRLSMTHKSSPSIRQILVDLSLKHKFYSDCFSIQKNFERLTKPDPRGLTFVHYTRIVAMALTVITHTGALGTLQAITKPADAANSEQIFRDLLPQMLANAFTSIQIFFFMAGFMLVISTYPSIKRDKGHMSFVEYAIKRAIRLMPGLAATICLNFIWPLVVDGPMLKFFDKAIVEPCEKNWWHTMAFVSNFDHVEKMCLRHSYFSASDYQLHIIAFPLLVLLYKQPSLALFLAAIFTGGGFVAQIIMILTKNVLPFMMVDYIDKEAFFNVVHYIHHPVWNHMSAFFYGFIIGYLVVKQIRINLSATTIKRTWMVLIPAGVISIFAPYFWNHYKRPIYKYQMVLYAIIDRFTLLTTCAWLSYATMVLARKPPRKPARPTVEQAKESMPRVENGGKLDSVKSPIERVLTKNQTSIATFDNQRSPIISSNDLPTLASQSNRLNSGSISSLPRQRSSPNLVYLQQQMQHQQQQQQQQLIGQPEMGKLTLNAPNMSGRLSRTVSSSNLAPIAEANPAQIITGGKSVELASKPECEISAQSAEANQQVQRPKVRSQAPVSNINILCLVLSRLTFQLYLFNMVVLCVDVNHSKYYWFFSYYFIIIKAAAVYICSAIMALIFFVVMESPSLTLYIAWVKGRAATRARSIQENARMSKDVKIIVPPPMAATDGGDNNNNNSNNNNNGNGKPATGDSQQAAMRAGFENVELPAVARPTFSFIDLSASQAASESMAATSAQTPDKPPVKGVDQTKM